MLLTAVFSATVFGRAHGVARFVPFVIGVTILAVAFGCGGRQTGQTPQELRLNLAGGLESLDPAFAKDLSTMWAAHMIYNTLVNTNEAMQVTPSLAGRWTISPDGKTYTFQLRSDIYFQDHPAFPGGKGRRLVAADVAYSFSRLIDRATGSPGAWIFHDRVPDSGAFSAPDERTFVLRLSAPFRPMLPMLSMPYCSIVAKEVVAYEGGNFRRRPCGTGPFQLRLWDEGAVLLLHRHPRYWDRDSLGQPLPRLQAVRFTFIDNKGAEFLLFLQGRLHFVNGIDGSFKDLVLTRAGNLRPDFAQKIQLQKGLYLNTEYIGFNTSDSQHPALRQPLVRQAMNYAIDRRRIVTYFKNGIGIPASGGFTPPAMTADTPAPAYGYTYDPDRAAHLLKEAGYPNGRGLPPLTIYTPDNYADIVNFVASQLNEVGIPARVEIMQPGILREQMAQGRVAAFRGQWIADYPDAETFLAVFYSTMPAPPNYTRFSSPLFDQLYTASLPAADSLRRALYRRMDSLAIREAPLMPLYYDQRLHFLQPSVRGFGSNPMNLIDVSNTWLEDAIQR